MWCTLWDILHCLICFFINFNWNPGTIWEMTLTTFSEYKSQPACSKSQMSECQSVLECLTRVLTATLLGTRPFFAIMLSVYEYWKWLEAEQISFIRKKVRRYVFRVSKKYNISYILNYKLTITIANFEYTNLMQTVS